MTNVEDSEESDGVGKYLQVFQLSQTSERSLTTAIVTGNILSRRPSAKSHFATSVVSRLNGTPSACVRINADIITQNKLVNTFHHLLLDVGVCKEERMIFYVSTNSTAP